MESPHIVFVGKYAYKPGMLPVPHKYNGSIRFQYMYTVRTVPALPTCSLAQPPPPPAPARSWGRSLPCSWRPSSQCGCRSKARRRERRDRGWSWPASPSRGWGWCWYFCLCCCYCCCCRDSCCKCWPRRIGSDRAGIKGISHIELFFSGEVGTLRKQTNAI